MSIWFCSRCEAEVDDHYEPPIRAGDEKLCSTCAGERMNKINIVSKAADDILRAPGQTVLDYLVEEWGIDVHRLTAAKMFNVPPDEVTKEQRQEAKRASYVALYGDEPETKGGLVTSKYEPGMAEVLDGWAKQGYIKGWSDLSIETQEDGRVVVSFSVHPPFDVGRLPEGLSLSSQVESFGVVVEEPCPICHATVTLPRDEIHVQCPKCGHMIPERDRKR